MKNTYTVLSLILTLVLLHSCTTKKQVELSDPNLFKEYITGFTSGMVSSQDKFEVKLNQVPESWTLNQELDKSLFSITPSVKGKVFYHAKNSISFLADQPLEHGQKYQITLHLSKINKVSKELSDFHFMVLTTPLNLEVELMDIHSVDTDTYMLHGRLQASDWISAKQAREILQAKLGKDDLKITMPSDSNANGTLFDFTITDIKRHPEPQTLSVFWNYDIGKQNLQGQSEVQIPAAGTFKAFKTFVDKTLENPLSFSINFSDPLNKNQNFDGLISLNHTDKVVFSTQGNVLKVSSDTPFDQNLVLTIHPGIESSQGIKTKTTETFELNFELPKPQVRLIQSGTILPSSENLKINFQAVNLKKVDVRIYQIYQNNILQFLQENNLGDNYAITKVASVIAKKTISLNSAESPSRFWNSYALDLSTLIKPNPGAIYRVEFSFKKAYSTYGCDSEQEQELEDLDLNQDTDLDTYYDYNFYENYQWEERDNPCHSSYYYFKEVGTNVLATDLAVIAKKGSNQNYTFIVSDIITTEPVSKAEIELYDFQQQLLQKVHTNNQGIATSTLDKAAYFAVVKKDNNTTYVRLDDGTSLSVSKYDVDGTSLQKGLQGYLYADRGVWRPADTIYLGFILDDSNNPLPERHPIALKVTDPHGKVIKQLTGFKNTDNHYNFEFNTEANAPTGNYEAQILVGGAQFYKRIKIETIKPNRLKIKNNIEGTTLQAGTQKMVQYQINWLQGTPGKNLQTEVQAKLRQKPASFKGFENYTFNNSLTADFQEELNLFSGRTDQQGQFGFNFPKITSAQNTSMLEVLVTTKVHEQGGDTSTDVSSVSYAPFDSYVGISAPQGNKYGLLETGTASVFKFQTLSSNAKARSANLKIELYKIDSQWWWDSSDFGISNYSTSSSHQLVKSETLTTNSKGQGTYQVTIEDQDWGRYEMVVTNLDSGHIASESFYIDWPTWSGKSKNNATQEAIALSIALDKDQYQVDDIAKISFPSSQHGRALISIENGSEILETHWVETTKGETVFDLKISQKMAPNMYVNITLIQPHANTLNNAPIRLYGIAPVSVYNKSSKLNPVIKIPESLEPEQEFEIEISESSKQPMSYTIAIVEEGLLDLTRFKTPNPWQSFYSKVALGVKTWDVYNDVIGAYSGTINQVFSIGGDEDLGAGKVKKANRFKPVVLFKGPFKLEKGKKAKHKFKLPNYIGSVRTMVIASNVEHRAYGHAEQTTLVKKPLMVLGSLPRRVVTSERITLPVTVFAMENSIKDVSINIQTDSKLTIDGSRSSRLHFEQPDEKVAYFDLQVGTQTGISKVNIEVRSAGHKATYEVELDVMNPNPQTYLQQSIVLEPNESNELNWDAFGIANSNKAIVEFSTFPGLNLNSRLNYLISYPHGCSEQITSGIFPQLFLSDLVELTQKEQSKIQANITKGIEKLALNQLADGSFTYWPGSRYFDDWSTSYIGHFFLEAEKKGYVLPIGALSNWISFQQKTARQWKFENRYGNDLAQSYRLYTLALAGSPDLASMNRLRETIGISNDSKLRLAAAYALSGQKQAAEALVNNTPWTGGKNFYFGSEERSLAMALETYLNVEQNQKAHQVSLDLAKRLSSNQWMSTQTTAYALLAMSKYLQKNKTSDPINLNYTFNGKSSPIQTNRSYSEHQLNPIKVQNQLSFSNHSKTRVYVNLSYSGILPVGQELVANSGLELKTQFKTLSGAPLSINALQQGTEFACEITVKNNGNQTLDNIALTQIIPSGWEIVNLRYTDASTQVNAVDYTDIRDDRSSFYFTLGPKESKVLKLTLNASYLGHYYLPGTQVNAMYDSNFYARTQGQWIDVVY